MRIEGNTIVANHQPSGGKTWMAKITGTHPKFGFNREFLNVFDRNYSSSGKTGTDTFMLSEDGFYELNEAWKDRAYFKVDNGAVVEIQKTEVVA